jgi:hypothetical protein
MCMIIMMMIMMMVMDMTTVTSTIIQPIDSTRSSKGTQELCCHVDRELLYWQLAQDHHGQGDCWVHMGPCNKGQNWNSKQGSSFCRKSEIQMNVTTILI